MPVNEYNMRVSGYLAVLLRVSRVFCGAPLLFESHRVRYSRIGALIGRVIVLVIGILVSYSIIPLVVFHIRGSNAILWCMFLCVSRINIIIMSIMGAYNAGSRIQIYMQSLDRLEKVNEEIPDARLKMTEKKFEYIVKTCAAIWIIIDFYNVFYEQTLYVLGTDYLENTNKAVTTVGLSVLFFIEKTICALFLIRFIFLNLRVLSTLRNATEYLARMEFSSCITFAPQENYHQLKIRQLALSYSSICDIVRQLLKQDEYFIILAVFDMFMNLEWVLYSVMLGTYNYFTYAPGMMLIVLVTTGFKLVVSLVLLIETSHRVPAEMNNTSHVVWYMMGCPRLSNKIYNELMMFRRLMLLDQPTYSPLGICRLSRLLLLKILGAILSYVVIALQFTV